MSEVRETLETIRDVFSKVKVPGDRWFAAINIDIWKCEFNKSGVGLKLFIRRADRNFSMTERDIHKLISEPGIYILPFFISHTDCVELYDYLMSVSKVLPSCALAGFNFNFTLSSNNSFYIYGSYSKLVCDTLETAINLQQSARLAESQPEM